MIPSPRKVGSPGYGLSPQLMSWEAQEREPQTLETKYQCVWDEGEGLCGAGWRAWAEGQVEGVSRGVGGGGRAEGRVEGMGGGGVSRCHPHWPDSTWGSILPPYPR